MGLVHGKLTAFKLDDLSGALIDISALLDKVSGLPAKTDRPETQTFGQVARRRQILGLRDGGPISAEGFWQPSTSVKVHGKSTRIILDQFPLTGYLREGAVTRTVDLPETQTFGDDWRERDVVGLIDGAVSFGGLFDAVAGGADPVFRAALAAQSSSLMAVGYNGFAIGNMVDIAQIVEGEYSIESAEEDLVSIDGSWETDERIDLAVSLHDLTAEVAPANFTSVDEAAQTVLGWVAQLHVSAFAGTNVTIKIQDSADNSVFADLAGATFTAATGPTKERLEGAATATVRRYVRAIISAGTFSSVTFVVAFSRRGYTYGSAGTHRHYAGLQAAAASSSFEYGPEGSAGGKLKLLGECRLSSYEVNFSEEDPSRYTLELTPTGAVAEGTF